MQSVLPAVTPRLLPGSSLPSNPSGAQSAVGPLPHSVARPDVDQFRRLPASNPAAKPVQFGGAGKAALFGTGGLASGVILWPLSIAVGLLGLFIHPLLPVAALMGVAPIGLSIWGAVAGAKS